MIRNSKVCIIVQGHMYGCSFTASSTLAGGVSKMYILCFVFFIFTQCYCTCVKGIHKKFGIGVDLVE